MEGDFLMLNNTDGCINVKCYHIIAFASPRFRTTCKIVNVACKFCVHARMQQQH